MSTNPVSPLPESEGVQVDSDFDALAARLVIQLRHGVASPWSDALFDEWAIASFHHQYSSCAPYRGLCLSRGVTPGNVATWEDIPAAPATAFKYFDLVSHPTVEPEAVFHTSGTTRGDTVRGRHIVPRLDLYRASLLGPLRAALVPDMDEIRMVSLIPDPMEATDSSLSFMVGEAAARLATGIDWLVRADGSWKDHTFDVMAEIRAKGEPVLLMGTALAFVHGLEELRPALADLPEGSRIMETGGFKGVRRRTIPRAELYSDISLVTGVATERIVNEYGMTELLSQLWEPVLLEGKEASGLHVPAPWLRVRALDPTTLVPVPDGEDGILAFFDIANLGSVCHVLTEDTGSVVAGRVRLRGRAPGAESRGCSRAMDDLMSGQAHG